MRDQHKSWVLLTGVTGFLGPALAHELLGRGHRVACLVRATTPADARRRVVRALRSWTEDVEHLLETGRLIALRGDVHKAGAGLDARVRASLGGRVRALVHAAGNTDFRGTSDGEPHRTNVDGTRSVLDLACALRCRNWHVVSTAYVAGVADVAYEAVSAAPPEFHNAYEHSKWQAEHIARTLAGKAGAVLTIHRPSIVVGHSETGRVTRRKGIYHLFRATALLARVAEQTDASNRKVIPLRIHARPEGCPNLICIDDVAFAFGELFDHPAACGGVYHLTHPAPPSNAQIKRVLEQCYELAGGTFVDGDPSGAEAKPEDSGAARFQALFDQATGPIRAYLFDAPRFDRREIERFVGRPPAAWSDTRLRRLVHAAQAAGWHPPEDERYTTVAPQEIARYFQDYLPRKLGRHAGERVGHLDLSVRFAIGPAAQGRWWCRFADGRVALVEPDTGQPADVIYRTSASRFWAAVSGQVSGAELFLSGEARIEGDIERALKFAMVLEEFVRNHPYQPATITSNPTNVCEP